MSPEGLLQGQSLPSSVSDALEAMVGGGLDDLTVGDLDPAAGLHSEMQATSDVSSLSGCRDAINIHSFICNT